MLVNPYHGEALWEILPENFYQIMFNYIFKLNPEYQKAVDEFKEKYFGGYTVGIQIRNPTHDKSGKKDHKGFPVPPLYLYAQAAEVRLALQIILDVNVNLVALISCKLY
jgi:hypothetical protein